MSGTVVDVTRLGSRWRAELLVGGSRIVVDGLPGANIPSTTLTEGRQATVTGIVRRPYPTATDRRFVVVPRSSADVAVGPAVASGGGSGGSSAPAAPGAAAAAAAVAAGATDVDLGQLDEHVGRKVRVGGLVVEVLEDGFLLNDGTATGPVLLRDGAAAYIPLLELDDALNAIGTVERVEAGVAVVVRDAAGLIRVGDLGQAMPLGDADVASPVPNDSGLPHARREAGLGDAFGLGPPGLAGAISIVLLIVASVAVTLLRRKRLRRELATRVAVRLSRIGKRPPETAVVR